MNHSYKKPIHPDADLKKTNVQLDKKPMSSNLDKNLMPISINQVVKSSTVEQVVAVDELSPKVRQLITEIEKTTKLLPKDINQIYEYTLYFNVQTITEPAKSGIPLNHFVTFVDIVFTEVFEEAIKANKLDNTMSEINKKSQTFAVLLMLMNFGQMGITSMRPDQEGSYYVLINDVVISFKHVFGCLSILNHRYKRQYTMRMLFATVQTELMILALLYNVPGDLSKKYQKEGGTSDLLPLVASWAADSPYLPQDIDAWFEKKRRK